VRFLEPEGDWQAVRICLEEITISVGAEVIGLTFVRGGEFGDLINPQAADGILNLPLLSLGQDEQRSHCEDRHGGQYRNPDRTFHCLILHLPRGSPLHPSINFAAASNSRRIDGSSEDRRMSISTSFISSPIIVAQCHHPVSTLNEQKRSLRSALEIY
jgi:hypothetical protein